MTRRRRTSRVLEKAEVRSSGLKAIDPNMNFDNNYNLQNMNHIIEQLRQKINDYNTYLTVIDSYQTEIYELEKTLSNVSERMMLGVAFKYGKDSREYEMAGGVRKSDRIRKSTATRIKTLAGAVTKENVPSV